MAFQSSEDRSRHSARYYELYTENRWFQDQYKHTRHKVYEALLRIVQELNVASVVDIGCSYGLMVDLLNENNIDTIGVELPINELKEFHKRLPNAQEKFLYGSADDKNFIASIAQRQPQAIIVSDTLRTLENPECLRRVNAQFIIVREISDNRRVRRWRTKEFDVRLYSPLDLVQLFPGYVAYQVYFFKSLFSLNRPAKTMLRAINAIFPSYSLVLKRERNGF